MARPRVDAEPFLGALPAAFTRQQALDAGLSDELLERLTREEKLNRFAHGMYADERSGLLNFDLTEAHLRSPRATVCLTSALARHDLVDEIPARIDLAISRGDHRARISAPVQWHQYEPTTFEIGRTTIELGRGLSMGLYDAPRSIVDAFNPRMGIPREQAIEALRAWLRRRGSQPSTLMAIAKHWPHARARLLSVLQVLL